MVGAAVPAQAGEAALAREGRPAEPAAASAPEDDQYRRARPPGEDLITADEIDLEDLTKHLYERVRRSLRADLIIERERVGLIADLR